MRGRDIKNGRFADNGSVPDDPLREKLERLAVRFAEQMLGETDREDPDRHPLREEDAAIFKTLTMFYTQTRRLPVAKQDDDDGEGFAALKERLNAGSDAAAADC
jgi:hypothetical protein